MTARFKPKRLHFGNFAISGGEIEPKPLFGEGRG
jgi:hypothetical protein